jgi:hypothetical protein
LFDSTAETEIVLDLDPQEAGRKKAQRTYRFEVIQVPLLRLLGLNCITLFIALHNLFIVESFSAPWFLLVCPAYRPMRSNSGK